jgi:geranylgeranyl diphosphate synthase type I
VAESVRLVDRVQNRIASFLAERSSILAAIAGDLAPLAEFSRQFLSGGKRFRAQFAYWGWRAAGGEDDSHAMETIVQVASSLELFQAAALVHDDIIDSSDMRRGAPSAHKRFETFHRESGFTGSPEEFGRAAAILLGDLLLGWSDEFLDDALESATAQVRRGVRRQFNRMRTDVMAGQYLDILEERAWLRMPEAELLERAQRVIVYKSAKYSVEAPLLIGAALAEARPAQLETLSAFGLPLGIAYQLRDDLLGVFGDSAVTGKPSGDDLREGKRTVLIAVARRSLPASARRVLDELLGDPALSADQVGTLQRTILECGAVDEVEGMIDRHVERANGALDEAALDGAAVEHLRSMTRRVTERVA